MIRVRLHLLEELPHIRQFHTEYLVDALASNLHTVGTIVDSATMTMLTNAISEELVACILFILILLVYCLFYYRALQFGDDAFVIAVV